LHTAIQSPPTNPSIATPPPTLKPSLTHLITHISLNSWAWRTWEFAVALILIRLYPGSLALISAYGLMENLVRVVGGAPVGRYIDRCGLRSGARRRVAARLWSCSARRRTLCFQEEAE